MRMPIVTTRVYPIEIFRELAVAVGTISTQSDAFPSTDFIVSFFAYWRCHHHRERRVIPTTR